MPVLDGVAAVLRRALEQVVPAGAALADDVAHQPVLVDADRRGRLRRRLRHLAPACRAAPRQARAPRRPRRAPAAAPSRPRSRWRVAAARQRRAVSRSSTASGMSAMPVPIASSMKPNQIQSTTGFTTTLRVAVPLGEVVVAERDVEVLGRRAPDGDLGGRLALVLVEEPLRRPHVVDHLAVHAARSPRR